MGGTGRRDASIQAFFEPTPHTSPSKRSSSSLPTSDASVGDGFTEEEVKEALKPKPVEAWQPSTEYTECEIRDLHPGPRPVTFMGRVANLFDVANTPKTPKSAKGCVKLCVKDDKAAITVRLWYADRLPNIRLGTLVSVWTDHISNGENGTLSSPTAPLFASLFPERDSSCHLMAHENSDTGSMCITPVGFREGRQLSGIMTLQNFVDGGYDVVDAKILVVVKSIGAKKKVTRKDESTVENVSLQVEDDTALATLGLWGTSALSLFATTSSSDCDLTDHGTTVAKQGWKAGETVLLIQAPGWKFLRTTYLHIASSTIVDVNPQIPDADWLRRWALRQRRKESINPPFPEGVFNLHAVKSGPVRCLFTLAELDEFARAAPGETFQGYLSILIMEMKLLEYQKRQMLLCGECCNMALYANATISKCKECDNEVALRLNPRIVGQVIDETAEISSGKLLFSDKAWKDLLGRGAEDLLKMGQKELKHLSDRLLFCRVTVMFGWTGDEAKAGGRICVMGIRS